MKSGLRQQGIRGCVLSSPLISASAPDCQFDPSGLRDPVFSPPVSEHYRVHRSLAQQQDFLPHLPSPCCNPPPLPSPSQPCLLAGICWCPPFILSLGQEGDEHGHLLVLWDAQPACAVRPQNTKGVSLGHAGLAAAGVGGRVPAGGCLCSQGCWGAGGHALSLRRWQETLRDFSTPPLVPACRVSIFPARGRWQDQGRASAGSAPPLLLQPSPAARIRAQPGLTPPSSPFQKYLSFSQAR